MIDSREVEYEAEGRRVRGHLAWPDGPGLHPAVLIGHEGIGLNDFQRERAERLAEQGFVAFAMDYLAGGWFPDPADMMAVLGPLLENPSRMHEVGIAAYRVLLDQPQVDPARIAAVGYGAGGAIVLELGRAGVDLAAIATVNPALPTSHPERWRQVTCPVLVCVGSEDPLAPADRLRTFAEEMRAADTDWQLIIHGGAEHAFHLPPTNSDGSLADGAEHQQRTDGVSYHPVHARRAWQAIVELLHETLDEPLSEPTPHARVHRG